MLANAFAFGSAYVVGARSVSFILVLVVHHEIQYLYFTYAMARRLSPFHDVTETGTHLVMKNVRSKTSYDAVQIPLPELKFAASFLIWPIVGFVGAIVGGWLELAWLAPFGVGGLFCHYWLDGRIWTRKSLNA